MVYRMGMTILKRRPCITGRAAVAEGRPFRDFSPLSNLFCTLKITGSPWAGPGDPGGALSGRRAHGRLRWPRRRPPRRGKGVNDILV